MVPDAIWLQPIFDIAATEHRIVGFEALSRFTDSTPEAILQQARNEDRFVEQDLEMAYAALQLIHNVPEPYYLSVNVASETLASREKLHVEEYAAAERVRLVGELTEQTMVGTHSLYRTLSRMRQLGIRYAVDDAGASHSNLFRVGQILPDMIKIDISIVASVAVSHVHRAVIEAIVTLGNGIKAVVVAEGIESREQLLWLRNLGVRYGQGYFLGMPAPLATWFPEESE